MDELNIGDCVLIRPRSSDFTYAEEEFDVMLYDIVLCRELGYRGVVMGVLHRGNTTDEARTAQLMEAAGTTEFTYHHTLDCAPDPIAAIHTLEDLGVYRILTSGDRKSTMEGLDLLKELSRIGGGQPTIMPDDGINAKSIEQVKATSFTDVHSSGTVFEELDTTLPFSFKTEGFLDESKRPISNVEAIRGIIGSLANSSILLIFN